MAQDRRSPPSATQDTNQPPIVRPHSATLSLSAFLVGCCDRSSSPPSQRRNPTAAAAILRTCGRPAVRSARIRTQRVDHPPPRSGIHTAASSGRGSAAVLLAPCSAPTATCAVARERSSPRRARTLPPFSIPWRQPKPTPPPALTTRAAVCSLVACGSNHSLRRRPHTADVGAFAFLRGRRQPHEPR